MGAAFSSDTTMARAEHILAVAANVSSTWDPPKQLPDFEVGCPAHFTAGHFSLSSGRRLGTVPNSNLDTDFCVAIIWRVCIRHSSLNGSAGCFGSS